MTASLRTVVAFLLCAGVFTSSQTSARPPDQDVESQIAQVVRGFMTAWAEHADSQVLADLLYATSDKFVLFGEGLSHPVWSVPELLHEFDALRDDWRPGCDFSLEDPLYHSGDLAVTPAKLTCPSRNQAEPFNFHVLLAWKQTPKGWRVVMESYTSFKP